MLAPFDNIHNNASSQNNGNCFSLGVESEQWVWVLEFCASFRFIFDSVFSQYSFFRECGIFMKCVKLNDVTLYDVKDAVFFFSLLIFS